jgi:hypothetical protein
MKKADMVDRFANVKVGDIVFGHHRVSKVMLGRFCLEGSQSQFQKSDGKPIRQNYVRVRHISFCEHDTQNTRQKEVENANT